MNTNYQLTVQLAEQGPNGEYSLSAFMFVPHTALKAGRVEILDETHRRMAVKNDVEIILHMDSEPVVSLSQLQQIPLTWQSKDIQLGKSWDRLIVHVQLPGGVTLMSIVTTIDADSTVKDFVSSKKQKLSELDAILSSMKDQGLGAEILINKQKQKGC